MGCASPSQLKSPAAILYEGEWRKEESWQVTKRERKLEEEAEEFGADKEKRSGTRGNQTTLTQKIGEQAKL